jgi:quercetin dioxygenase-like cupin family protein
MPLEILPVKRPDWTPLPYEGCEGVYAKSLLSLDHLGIAMLKFEPNATIHKHDAPFDIDVICLEGAGFTSVDGEQAPIQAGERVRWPVGKMHRLWTKDGKMVTLMVEHGK